MKNSIITILFLLAVMLTGCGGGHHLTSNGGGGGGSTSSSSSAQMSHGTIPGMHIHAVNRTVASRFSMGWDGLFPTVYAQSSITVVVAQNWEGVCRNSPQPGTGQQTVSYPLFGIGENGDAACLNSFNDTDGSAAANNANEGKLVFGSGTLSNLIASTDRGTNISSSGGVPIKVWVKRNNTILFTGISCVLPSGANELICQGTGTFAAQNLDRVIATATKGDSDVLVNLSVNFTKTTTP